MAVFLRELTLVHFPALPHDVPFVALTLGGMFYPNSRRPYHTRRLSYIVPSRDIDTASLPNITGQNNQKHNTHERGKYLSKLHSYFFIER